jgi:phosphoglycolate phosphatase (TIGR01487 family)
MHPPNFSPSALVCDIDGTITDARRRISTDAVLAIRRLVDGGIPVVLASGNTICSLDILCKMIGTDGSIIAENGGVYRRTFSGTPHICGDRRQAWEGFERLRVHFAGKGVELELYSPDYRFADVAFARTVDVTEVRRVVASLPVQVLDTGFAVHLQAGGVNKGSALVRLAGEMGRSASDFMAVGDSENDIEMLRNAGVGVAVANGHPSTQAAADWVAKNRYGDGFVEAVRAFFPYFLISLTASKGI